MPSASWHWIPSVAEPSGAVSAGRDPVGGGAGRGIDRSVVSGGNVDPTLLARVLES